MTQRAIWAALGLSLAGASAANAQSMTLTSTDLKEGATIASEQVFKGFGCTGGNLSPALNWSGAPSGTKSFAISMYDPDAPTGSGWWHWVVYDIPASVHALPGGIGVHAQLPAGVKEGRNDYGAHAFGGTCPPAGDKPHHYIFTVYALKVDKLEVPDDASSALIGFSLHANSLGEAQITATYSR